MKTILIGSLALALLFVVVEYTGPAAVESVNHSAQLRHCILEGWVSDTCVEMPEFWEYN